MTKQNVFLVIVVMLISAHHADIVLSAEQKVVDFFTSLVGPSDSDSSVPSGSGNVHGIDVSHWQTDISQYFKSNPDKWSFVICKATEGVSFVDTYFDTNWTALSHLKIVRGAYHYYHPENSSQGQLKNFLSTVPRFERSDLPPIVDVEYVPYSSYAVPEFADSLMLFLNQLESQTKRTPMIYTNYNFGKKYLKDSGFARFPLWIADVQPEKPRMVGDWESWFFWQTGHEAIGSDTVDYDVFNGTRNDLKQFIKNY